MTKVLHISTHADFGGAAKSTSRLFKALRSAGASGEFISLTRDEESESLAFLPDSIEDRIRLAKQFLDEARTSQAKGIASAPGLLEQINGSGADIVNLHWVNGALSIEDIGKIRKPVVWTLLDMWAFSGGGHYPNDDGWQTGYANRSEHSIYQSEQETWLKKQRHWTTPFQMIAPSHWLGRCVKKSALMHDWPLHVIPHPIDTVAWRPLAKDWARASLGLPSDKRLILFGAAGGTSDPRKGFDLLEQAMSQLPRDHTFEIVVFGDNVPARSGQPSGHTVHHLGLINNEPLLNMVYCAADLIVIPSRQDNLPNVALEALACGTPIVAFEGTGLADTVEHKRSGYLAKPYDAADLAAGIAWILGLDQPNYAELCINSRTLAETRFSNEQVAEQYMALYESVLAKDKKGEPSPNAA